MFSTSTEWSYLDHKHRRTASLSRNLTRRSRSVTMPNIEATHQQQPPFSTFHGSNSNSCIPPKPPRKTKTATPSNIALSSPLQGGCHEVKNDLGLLGKTSYISPYGTISHHPRQHQPRVSQNRVYNFWTCLRWWLYWPQESSFQIVTSKYAMYCISYQKVHSTWNLTKKKKRFLNFPNV